MRLFSRKDVKPFVFDAAIGHYSQMVWADTYKVISSTVVIYWSLGSERS